MNTNKPQERYTPLYYRNNYTHQSLVDNYRAIERISRNRSFKQSPQDACDDLDQLWRSSVVKGSMSDGRKFMYFLLPPPSKTISEETHILLSELGLEKKHHCPLDPLRVCFGIYDPTNLDIIVPILEPMVPDKPGAMLFLAKKYYIKNDEVPSGDFYLCTNKGVLFRYRGPQF